MKKILVIIIVQFFIIMSVFGEERIHEAYLSPPPTKRYPIFDIHIVPNTKNMVIDSFDHDIKVFNIKTGKLNYVLKGHKGGIYALLVSKDGKTLVSSSNDKTIKIWDLEKKVLLKSIDTHNIRVKNMVFALNEQVIIGSGRKKGRIWVWDRCTGKLIKEFKSHKKYMTSLVMDEERKLLITGYEDGFIQVWDIKNDFKELYSWNLLYNTPTSMYLYKEQLLIGGLGYKIGFWEKSGNKYVKNQDFELNHSINTFKTDGDIMLVRKVKGNHNGDIVSYNIKEKRLLKYFYNHPLYLYSIAIDVNKKIIVAGGEYGNIVGMDMETGKELYSINIKKHK